MRSRLRTRLHRTSLPSLRWQAPLEIFVGTTKTAGTESTGIQLSQGLGRVVEPLCMCMTSSCRAASRQLPGRGRLHACRCGEGNSSLLSRRSRRGQFGSVLAPLQAGAAVAASQDNIVAMLTRSVYFPSCETLEVCQPSRKSPHHNPSNELGP